MIKLFPIWLVVFATNTFAVDSESLPAAENTEATTHSWKLGIMQDALDNFGKGLSISSFYFPSYPLTVEYQSTRNAGESGFINATEYFLSGSFLSVSTRFFLTSSFYIDIGLSRRTLDLNVEMVDNQLVRSQTTHSMTNLGMIQSFGHRWWLTDSLEIAIDWYKIFVNMATATGGAWTQISSDSSEDSTLRSIAERTIESNSSTMLNLKLAYCF